MPTLRLMTYNIRVGVETDLAQVGDALRAVGAPDLLAIQETGVGWYMGGGADQPAALAQAAGLPHHVFGPALTRPDGGQFGIALAARWPLRQITHLQLPRVSDEQRVLLRATLLHPAGPVTVITSHLSVAADEREAQARVIQREVEACTGPVILLGDFNDRPQTPTLQTLTASLTDCFDACGVGPEVTFSVADPHRRIDYILCGGGLTPVPPCEVARGARASDHFPLVAHVAWPPQR